MRDIKFLIIGALVLISTLIIELKLTIQEKHIGGIYNILLVLGLIFVFVGVFWKDDRRWFDYENYNRRKENDN